ncbi:MAG: response regulator [Longimicrobiaceae bacterium]
MTRPSVLLVDDRVAVRRTLRSILAGFGCDFVEAADGETALALIAARPFDVIFLDLKLPDFSGTEILRLARERCERLGRVIVLTGFLEPEAKEETAKLGVFKHLTKDPINHADVRAAFATALAGVDPPPSAPTRDSGADHAPRPAAKRSRARPAGDTRDDSRPRILVLDDRQDCLDTIARVLGSEFTLTLTTDPEDACRRVRKERFDLVILDMRLPGGVSGLDVLTRMAETTPNLKAIIFTEYPGEGYDAAIESVRRGARTFVVKSQIASLSHTVKQVLNELVAAPSVFLSYDRRDRSTVSRLYKRLQQRGVLPWMDVNDLLGGTQYDPKIAERIEKSDHFVFCHSRHSRDKEGLLRKELNLALERQKGLREDRHFLITARLDQTEVIGPLAKFHYVDLFGRDGFENLMRAISADAKLLQ